MLDERGNPINKRNAWATRSVAYVRLIPPGAADTVHYRLRVPEDRGDRITVKARLNYRKFAWWNTQWAFAGVRDPEHRGFSLAPGHDDGRWVFTGDTSGVSGQVKDIPDLPVTVMHEAEAALRVLPRGAPEPKTAPFLDASVRERWNDYGLRPHWRMRSASASRRSGTIRSATRSVRCCSRQGSRRKDQPPSAPFTRGGYPI